MSTFLQPFPLGKYITLASTPRSSKWVSNTHWNVFIFCYIPDVRTIWPYPHAVQPCNWPATQTGCRTSCPAERQAPWCTSARQLTIARRVRVRIGGASTPAHPVGSCYNYMETSHVPAVYTAFWQRWLDLSNDAGSKFNYACTMVR
jgi:hypothetical protein